jgi:glycosyltransferase involved in cell wall biosynthesis
MQEKTTLHADPAVLKVAVIIPCYRVKQHVLDLLIRIDAQVHTIYAIDDACPDRSGLHIQQHCHDSRVRVLFNEKNLGVGGAVMVGYKQAVADGMDVLVKMDGDGQMNPALLADFVRPILHGEADYTKGNRFFDLEGVRAMPPVRIFGNAVLSVMSKLSTGYWHLFDPTNGYTAVHAAVVTHLPLDKISQRYFFETDMLFRLNTIGAVVLDVPMDAHYGDEVSGLKIRKIVGEFLFKHLRNSMKRIFYNHYLRNVSIASIELPLGLLLLGTAAGYGGYHWAHSAALGVATPAGTVVLAAVLLLAGLQFLLAFLAADMAAVPTRPLHLTQSVRRVSKPTQPASPHVSP